MSQHITGNVGQRVETEHGPFITIGDMRIRKSLIQAYRYAQNPREVLTVEEGLAVTFSNGIYFIKMDDKESAEREVEKLDWLFKKDYQNE